MPAVDVERYDPQEVEPRWAVVRDAQNLDNQALKKRMVVQ